MPIWHASPRRFYVHLHSLLFDLRVREFDITDKCLLLAICMWIGTMVHVGTYVLRLQRNPHTLSEDF